MDYDTISKMKVPELKTFLKLRGLKVSGRKCELIARVFSAVENNVQVVKTAEEVEHELSKEYISKLTIDDIQIPDPFKLETGWEIEEDGIKSWPHVSTFYIIKFLMMDNNIEDLNDYKKSKAYSYFENGWLGNISYNSLNENSLYSLMKTDCRPSQRISDTKHKLWLLFSKKNGNVLNAHCTCMAGMGSTCNHVAAALFRIEAAMRLGLANPSCTTKPCEWLPNRRDVLPCRAKDMNLNRDDFTKREKPARKLLSSPKRNYNPLENCTMKMLSFDDMVKVLENNKVLKDTTLSIAIPKPEEKVDFVVNVLGTKKERPKPVPLSVDDIILLSDSAAKFMENLSANLDEENISIIEKITKGQNTNELWFQFRKGVITASKVHEVKTKMSKVNVDDKNMWSLIKKVSGFTFINPNIPALKYGRDMENHAADKLLHLLKTKHTGVKMKECGLFLDATKPFIGASPDRIFECKCHGKVCIEIKCPYSISHLSPLDKDAYLCYLDYSDKGTSLKKSHTYYTQCQLQMGVTKIEKCYFFIYTSHGYLLSEINFDKEFFLSLVEKCCKFYEFHYLKSIYK